MVLAVVSGLKTDKAFGIVCKVFCPGDGT